MRWERRETEPRILLVTRNLPPLVGGMERLLYHTYLELSKEFRMGVVGPEGCGPYLGPNPHASFVPIMPPARFLVSCQWKTFRLAQAFMPDLIVAGSGVTAPASLMAGIAFNIPVLCYLHGLDLVTQDPVYRMAFIPAIKACDALIVNSRNTFRLAEAVGIEASRISILHPGVQLPQPGSAPSPEVFKQQIGAGSRPILLSVGRLTRRKGIVEFIHRCLPELVREQPDILFVVIGNEAYHSMTGSYGMIERIRHAAAAGGLEKHVLVLENIDDTTLLQAYAASRLLIFPVIEIPNDVEGFGMVAVEAAAHGLATVAFAVGGVADAVKDGFSGYLVEPGNYEKLKAIVLQHLGGKDHPVSKEGCRQFAELFSWERFGARLRKICRDITIHSRKQ